MIRNAEIQESNFGVGFQNPSIFKMLNRKTAATKFIRYLFGQWFHLALIMLCLAPSSSYALELYTVLKNDCETETGLIVHTDSDNAYLLNLAGKLAIVERELINVVLVYNVHDNPIKNLDLTSGLQDYLREVHVDDKENTRFLGWPTRFLENLIIFHDIEGKTHLVDTDKIKHFSLPEESGFLTKDTAQFKHAEFGLGGNLPEFEKELVGIKNSSILPG